MSEILAILVPWLASIALLFALLHWDESRLSPTELARAWPPASRSVAVVYFGVASLPVHFGRTRRSVLGVLQGLAWGAAILVTGEGLGAGLEQVLRHVTPS